MKRNPPCRRAEKNAVDLWNLYYRTSALPPELSNPMDGVLPNSQLSLLGLGYKAVNGLWLRCFRE